MNALNKILKTAQVVGEQSYHNLTLKYMSISQAGVSNLVNYRQAIESGVLKVTEVDEFGNVPELLFNNTGTMPVFVPEGSIIEGNLKQNRFVQVSFMLNCNQSLKIPVNCVQQSRWSNLSAFGSSSRYHMYSSIRACSSKSIKESLKRGGGYKSNSQGVTWNSISKRLNATGTDSQESYVGAYYENNREKIDEYTGAFKCPDTANGLIAIIDGFPIECSVMTTNLFKENFEGILSGLVVEAFNDDYRRGLQDKKKLTVRQFLASISKSKKEENPSLGIGTDIRFETTHCIGSALVNDDELIYLGAYAL